MGASRAAWPSACVAAWRTASSTVGASAMANSSDWPSTSTWTVRACTSTATRSSVRRRASELDPALLLVMAQPHCSTGIGAPATAPDVAGQQSARRRGGRCGRPRPRRPARAVQAAPSGRSCRSSSRRRAWPALDQPAQVAEVGADAQDGGLAQRVPQCGQRGAPIRTVDDQLGEQRVVSVRSPRRPRECRCRPGRRPASGGRPRARWPAGSPRPDPPRTGGPRSRVPRIGPGPARRPAARRRRSAAGRPPGRAP